MEDQRLIVSIPSALHSQKPSLSGQCRAAGLLFSLPPEGNAAASMIVISPYSLKEKSYYSLLWQTSKKKKSVSQLFMFAWLKFKRVLLILFCVTKQIYQVFLCDEWSL